MNKLHHILFFAFTLLIFSACQNISAISQLDGLYRVDGSAMNPSYPDETVLGVDGEAYKNSSPQRGDLVIIKHPTSDLIFIKRIVGLPSETVIMENGELSINGLVLTESYIEKPAQYRMQLDLGNDEYAVLGDNRNASSDSHIWGVLSFDNIIGKAVSVCSGKSGFSCTTKIEPIEYPD